MYQIVGYSSNAPGPPPSPLKLMRRAMPAPTKIEGRKISYK